MNKAELIEAIAKDTGLSKAKSGEVLDSTLNTISKNLKRGKNVTLIGFGTFSVNKRKARKGRNPQTGEEIKIKAKKIAKFKAGKRLSDNLN